MPVGGYDFDTRAVGYNFGQQRALSGNVLGRARHLLRRPQHDARLQPAAASNLTPQLVDRAGHLGQLGGPARRARSRRSWSASRVTYTMTPLMFVSALRAVQLEQRRGRRQRPAALGISAGQRAVRRLQRASATRWHRALPDLDEPRVHRQGQPAVPLLTRGASPSDCPDTLSRAPLTAAPLPLRWTRWTSRSRLPTVAAQAFPRCEGGVARSRSLADMPEVRIRKNYTPQEVLCRCSLNGLPTTVLAEGL